MTEWGRIDYDMTMLPVLLSVGPFSIYSMGLMMVLGILFGGFAIFKKAREAHLEAEHIFDVLFFGLFWGLVGARFLYIVTHFSEFGFNLLRFVWMTNYVGLSFWGAFIFGVGAVIFKVRQLEGEIFDWLDYLSLGMCLGIGFGLVGAFLNGSFLGREFQYGLSFPGVEQKLLPIQLIGASAFFLFFVWWWGIEKKYRMFEWYRAGKVSVKTGFLWFGFLIFFGSSWSVMSLLLLRKTTMLGLNLDLVFSLSVLAAGVVGLYARSGRKLSEELKNLRRGRRRRYSKLAK